MPRIMRRVNYLVGESQNAVQVLVDVGDFIVGFVRDFGAVSSSLEAKQHCVM